MTGDILLVDKPAGWTSFDVVHRLRGALHTRKIGHAGTLDPSATGLLIVCTGEALKSVDRFVGLEKEYEAELVLGIRTASFDLETPVLEEKDVTPISPAMVVEPLKRFLGPQAQIPPMWSAVKIRGKRLYEYARKGQEIGRPPRPIMIHTLRAREIEIPRVQVTLVCSKGTYVRALVNDIGNALGCGAVLTQLRRTRIGPYTVEAARSVAEIIRDSVQPGVGVP